MAGVKQQQLLKHINQLFIFQELEHLYRYVPKMLGDVFEVQYALLLVKSVSEPQTYNWHSSNFPIEAFDAERIQNQLKSLLFDSTIPTLEEKTESLAVPIVIGETTIGAVYITQPTAHTHFGRQEAEFFQDFAQQIATAIRVLMLRTEHQIEYGAIPSEFGDSESTAITLTEALLDVAQALTSEEPLNTLLGRILENAKRVIPCDAANIMLIDGDQFEIASTIGYEKFGQENWSVKFSETTLEPEVFHRIVTNMVTVILNDVRAVKNWVVFPGFEWIRSHAKATLKIGGELIGILNLDSSSPNTFNENQTETLRLLADQAALAIYVTRLIGRERERHQVEEMLRESARFLNETLDLDEVLTRIMVQIGQVANCDTGSVQVLRGGVMEIVACHGFDDPASVIGQQFDIVENPIFAQIMKELSPLLVVDAPAHPHFKKYFTKYKDILFRTWLGVPLVVRGKLIGMITLDRLEKKPFTEDEINRTVAFTNHAAIALDNARLHAVMSERAVEKERSWSQAVETNRVRTQLITNVAHDIRSPLSTIMTSLIMLRDGTFGELSKDQQDWVQTCINNLDHVLRLSQDFFDFTKSEMGQLTVYATPVELGVFLSRMYRLGQSLPWADDVSFGHDFAESLPTVQLDKTRIQQVLMNLLYNALKFTEVGQVTMYATYKKGSPTVRIGVRDTGIGIPSEELDTIFERFKQVGETRHRQQGTGIGLAVCKEIVRLHDGEIFVDSKSGVGSDFYFTLPTDSV